MRPGRFLLLAAIVVAAAGPVTPSSATVKHAPGSTVRQSTGVAHAEPNGATPAVSVTDTTSPALSLDGLTVAFSSDASNLVTADTNTAADVFVRKVKGG